MDFGEISSSMEGLTVYYGISEDKTVKALTSLLTPLPLPRAVEHWGRICKSLNDCGMSLPDYVYLHILRDENQFTRRCALYHWCDETLTSAAGRDLTALGALARLTPQKLRGKLLEWYPEDSTTINSLPDFDTEQRRFEAPEEDWGNETASLKEYLFENGCCPASGA